MHGSFDLVPISLGLKKGDQTYHSEQFIHLHDVHRSVREREGKAEVRIVKALQLRESHQKNLVTGPLIFQRSTAEQLRLRMCMRSSFLAQRPDCFS